MTATIRAALLAPALLAAACLGDDTIPAAPQTLCHETAECPAAADGQICDDGVCWGTPPALLRFAAVLLPPVERAGDLAPTELAELTLAPDGTIAGLAFERPVVVTGRVTLDGAPSASVQAQIRVSRPSRIPGGAPYVRSALAAAGIAVGGEAFRLVLPPTSGGAPYDVLVTPTDVATGDGAAKTAPAPPLRFTWTVEADGEVEWVVRAGVQVTELQGRVVDAAGRGVAGMRVVVLGRWVEGEPLEQVSTIGATDDAGQYTLRVVADAPATVDLVASPDDTTAPTLRAFDVAVPTGVFPSGRFPDLVMPTYPRPVPFAIPIRGRNGAGGPPLPVVGADVRLRVVLASSPASLAVFEASTQTGQDGRAVLDLIPGGDGNRMYIADVVPLPADSHAARFAELVAVGPPNPAPGASVLPAVDLDYRVTISGTLVSAKGAALDGAAVRVTAAAALRAKLDAAGNAALDTLDLASVVTDSHGRFALWLDPSLLGVAAVYDLDLGPRGDALAPRWSYDGITPTAGSGDPGSVMLGDIELPPPSFARGPVTDADGTAVAGAQIQIDQLGDSCPGDAAACPVRLRGTWASGTDGEVRVVLPDPQE